MLAGTVLLSAFVTGGTLAVTASGASANPSGCTTTNGRNFAESRCEGGDGEHRVVMRQQHFDPNVGDFVCVGPWVPVGLVSRVACGPHAVISVTVETRAGSTAPPSGGAMDDVRPQSEPEMIRVPVPPGMNTPVPVDCFSQLFQSLIVRTRDNARAYTYFVDIIVCNNPSGSFVAIGKLFPYIELFEPAPEEIVSIEVLPKSVKSTRLSDSAVVVEAQVLFKACLDVVNRARCITYLHNFSGSANDRRGVSASFTFNEVI